MNDLNLVYHPLDWDELPIRTLVSCPDHVFKQVRRLLKPRFTQHRLRYENVNGCAAHLFNRRIGRFRWDWLPFLLPEYKPCEGDYPSNGYIDETNLIQETVIASRERWHRVVQDEIAENKIYLMVGMKCLVEQEDFRPCMLSSGIPARLWPCEFEIFEMLLTNAPSTLFIKYRSHVVV